MESTRCREVSPKGLSFDRLEAELAELARLADDGRDVEDIRIERSIELAQLEANAGNTTRAHGLLDELLVDLGARTDRDGIRLAIDVRSRRAAFARLAHEAADGYGLAYELASEAVTRWKTDRELALQFVQVARDLGESNRSLASHEAAIAACDKALIVCGRFVDDTAFLRLDAEVSVERAEAMRAAGKPIGEILPWFDRALGKHDDLVMLSTFWHSRGSAQHPRPEARADYQRSIDLLESRLPNYDAAIRISKSSHNLALVLREAPAEALPFETRAVELMYDVIEQRGSDENRYDLLLYRLTRAELLARSGVLAAAIEEAREVLPALEEVMDRGPHDRGLRLLANHRDLLGKWTAELARRTPAVHRTLPRAAVIAPDAFRCTFCKRARVEVTKLISGPRVFICNHCVVAATTALPADAPGSQVECGFCGEQRRRFVGTADGVICDDCLGMCGEILEEDLARSHPELRCSFCGSERAEVERLVLGPDATALCASCFRGARTFLGHHHPYDPSLGRRRGTRETHFDVCDWCTTREALAFVHGERLVLCDACVDATAQDLS